MKRSVADATHSVGAPAAASSRPEVPRWVCLVLITIGAYIVLLSLGVLPYSPWRRGRALFDDPHHWQITSFGIAFASGGISMLFAGRRHVVLVLNAAVLLVSFLAPMYWVLFLSGAADRLMQIMGGIPLAVAALGGLLGLLRTARRQ